MKTTESPTAQLENASAAKTALIEEKTAQIEKLRGQESTLSAQRSAAREELARGIADGKTEAEQSKIRAKSRELAEQIEGIGAAIPLIEKEIDEARDQIKRLAVSVAMATRADAEREFEEARIKAEETFSAFWEKFSSGEIKAFTEAMNRYHRAAMDEEAATGRKEAVLVTERPGQGQIQRVIFAVSNALDPIAGGYGIHEPVHSAPEKTGTWRDLALPRTS
jgi:chromosome segregation ATPase